MKKMNKMEAVQYGNTNICIRYLYLLTNSVITIILYTVAIGNCIHKSATVRGFKNLITFSLYIGICYVYVNLINDYTQVLNTLNCVIVYTQDQTDALYNTYIYTYIHMYINIQSTINTITHIFTDIF